MKIQYLTQKGLVGSLDSNYWVSRFFTHFLKDSKSNKLVINHFYWYLGVFQYLTNININLKLFWLFLKTINISYQVNCEALKIPNKLWRHMSHRLSFHNLINRTLANAIKSISSFHCWLQIMEVLHCKAKQHSTNTFDMTTLGFQCSIWNLAKNNYFWNKFMLCD